MAQVRRRIYRFCVDEARAGMCLEKYLSCVEAELNSTLVRKIIDIGGVSYNGRRIRTGDLTVSCADTIEVHIDGFPLTPYRVKEEDILFRDPYLIILSKPALIDTQPTAARYKGTLYEALLTLLTADGAMRHRGKPELGMMQRLDRETSGAVLFSTHTKAHRPLTQAFAERRVKKTYLALVAGCPSSPEREIISNLARTRDANRVKSVQRGGKEAITRYRVIEQFADAALLEVVILTGRSHQIRVHLAELGHPLLGDLLYGGVDGWFDEPLPRLMLHSHRLVLTHPISGESLTCTAPLPSDMANLLEKMQAKAKKTLEKT